MTDPREIVGTVEDLRQLPDGRWEIDLRTGDGELKKVMISEAKMLKLLEDHVEWEPLLN